MGTMVYLYVGHYDEGETPLLRPSAKTVSAALCYD